MTRLVTMEGIHKAFPPSQHTARAVGLWHALRGETIPGAREVLHGIDLHVNQGESLGIVGENGAGKSTLLKILTGVLKPTRGRVRTRGRIGALLELGAGFHPDFSGRDNVELSAALSGLSRRRIRAALPEIEAFADIGDAIDEPIRHYSSGMVVRLGFAIITVTRPDLLVTDEVLAVGDESFQRKCIRWIEDYLEEGGTLLVVSHGMDAIRRLCSRACWLREGRIERMGDADEVTDAYLAFQEERGREQIGRAGIGTGEYRLSRVVVAGDDGQDPLRLDGDTLELSLEVHSPDDRPPVVALGLSDRHGTPVYGLTTEMEDIAPRRLAACRYGLGIEFDLGRLQPGEYTLRCHALDPEGLRLFDTVTRTVILPGHAAGDGFLALKVETLD